MAKRTEIQNRTLGPKTRGSRVENLEIPGQTGRWVGERRGVEWIYWGTSGVEYVTMCQAFDGNGQA